MKLLKWLNEHFENVFLTGMLILLTCLVMLQIIMRYLVHNPLTWSEELCKVLLVWSGFFSIGYCAKRSSTIKLDTVVVLLPAMVQRILMTITTVMMIGLLSYLLMGAFQLVSSIAASGSRMAGLQIPMYWLYVGPLLGLALGIFRFVQSLVVTKCFKNLGKEDAE